MNNHKNKFYKIDWFIRDWTNYLVLFASEKYDFIYNRIRYLISVKIGVTYMTSHNYAKAQSRFIRFFTSRKNTFVVL